MNNLVKKIVKGGVIAAAVFLVLMCLSFGVSAIAAAYCFLGALTSAAVTGLTLAGWAIFKAIDDV